MKKVFSWSLEKEAAGFDPAHDSGGTAGLKGQGRHKGTGIPMADKSQHADTSVNPIMQGYNREVSEKDVNVESIESQLAGISNPEEKENYKAKLINEAIDEAVIGRGMELEHKIENWLKWLALPQSKKREIPRPMDMPVKLPRGNAQEKSARWMRELAPYATYYTPIYDVSENDFNEDAFNVVDVPTSNPTANIP